MPRGWDDDYWWARYVPTGTRKARAVREAARLEKKGQTLQPVILDSGKIAKTFWGKAWCQNLERYSDYSNRLPRGRSYVRGGAVIDLKITKGHVQALVSGSRVYDVEVHVA